MTEENFIQAPNGIRIYGYRSPYLHSFCLCLYVKAGPLYESDAENGISHFFEHMAFRSINAAMNGELYAKADLYGLTMNAVTYKEFIQFKITGATPRFREAAEILTKIFVPFSVPHSELETERKRIRSEMRENDDKNSLEYFSQKRVWQGTSLVNTIIGKNSNLGKVSLSSLAAYQKKALSKDNIFFYLTGNCGEDGEKILADLLSGVSAYGSEEKRENVAKIPENFGNRNCDIAVKNSREHVVRFSFDLIASRMNTAEQYLLYDILFAGECSKMFKELSNESGLVYSYDACLEKYNNIGTISFLYEVGAKDVYTSVEKVVGILCDLKKGITDELSHTKPFYTENCEMLLDEPEELNYQLGYEYKIMGKPFLGLEARRKEFEDCTSGRMTEIVREIFRCRNLVLTFKGDARRFDTERVRMICEALGE